jgi:hypothetical protein
MAKKNTKIVKVVRKYWWVSLLLLFLLVTGFFLFRTQQGALVSNNIGSSMTFTETSSDAYSTTYHATWVNQVPQSRNNACGGGMTWRLGYTTPLLLSSSSMPNGYTSTFLGIKNGNIQGLGSFGNVLCGPEYAVKNSTVTGKCKTGDAYYGFECVLTIEAYSVDETGKLVEAQYYGGNGGSFDFTLLKNGVECTTSQSSLCDSGKECKENKCVDKVLTSSPALNISTPAKVTPTLFSFLTAWKTWIFDLFRNILNLPVSQTITGPSQFLPGTVQSYQISLSTNQTDSNSADGNFSYQYATWILVGKDGNIVKDSLGKEINGTWEEVNGFYNKQITITTPQKLDEYALIGVISQTNLQYDFATNTWKIASENVVAKEGIYLLTGLPIPEKVKPTVSLASIVNSIIDFFKRLFNIT